MVCVLAPLITPHTPVSATPDTLGATVKPWLAVGAVHVIGIPASMVALASPQLIGLHIDVSAQGTILAGIAKIALLSLTLVRGIDAKMAPPAIQIPI